MQWNNFTQFVFIAYIFIMPLLVGIDPRLKTAYLKILVSFDVTFMMDRVLDLFVGYYKADGTEEHRLSHVIW